MGSGRRATVVSTGAKRLAARREQAQSPERLQLSVYVDGGSAFVSLARSRLDLISSHTQPPWNLSLVCLPTGAMRLREPWLLPEDDTQVECDSDDQRVDKQTHRGKRSRPTQQDEQHANIHG